MSHKEQVLSATEVSIHMDTINGEDASSGPYANALIINFDAAPDFKHQVVYQKKHMQARKA
jgi:hypothetical protein